MRSVFCIPLPLIYSDQKVEVNHNQVTLVMLSTDSQFSLSTFSHVFGVFNTIYPFLATPGHAKEEPR